MFRASPCTRDKSAGNRVFIIFHYRKEANFMKKVLKLILAVAIVAALCVTALAAPMSPHTVWFNVEPAGASELVAAYGEVDDDTLIVTFAPPTEDGANKTAAQTTVTSAGQMIEAILDSFDIDISLDGQPLHDGMVVNVIFNIPTQYMGMFLNIFETTDGVSKLFSSQQITSESMTIPLNSFSTFTPVITAKALRSAVAPQTMQSVMPYALAIVSTLGIFGTAYAGKRRFFD